MSKNESVKIIRVSRDQINNEKLQSKFNEPFKKNISENWIFQRHQESKSPKIEDFAKNYKNELQNSIIFNIKEVQILWKRHQNDTIYLRVWYGYTMLALLAGQVIFFAVLLVLILYYNKTALLTQISFASYSASLVAQLVLIPKIIAEHLFPKKQTNQLSKILKLAIKHQREDEIKKHS